MAANASGGGAGGSELPPSRSVAVASGATQTAPLPDLQGGRYGSSAAPVDGVDKHRSDRLPELHSQQRRNISLEYQSGFNSTRTDSVLGFFATSHAVPGIADPGSAEFASKVASGALPAGQLPSGGLSSLQTCINTVKCAIGAGSFSLPYAFMLGGLWLSIVGTLALGALSAYTVEILARCERVVWQQHKLRSTQTGGAEYVKLLEQAEAGDDRSADGSKSDRSRFTYPQLGRLVFPNASWDVMGTRVNVVEIIIYVGIVLTSVGVCAAYVDFITGTMPSLWPQGEVTQADVAWAISPIILAMAMLRTFRFLSFTSILGDVAVTVGLIAVVAYAFMHTDGLQWDLPAYQSTFPRFFASTSFLFAIHIVILPIMQSMEKRDNFPRVVGVSYTFITLINTLFAALCYMLFGADTQGNVVHNLDSGSLFLSVVKVLLCVDLLFTIPMVLAASREIVEEWVLTWVTLPVETTRNIVRVVMVGAVYAVCFGVPDFLDMVGLVGGFVNSLMGFVLPPLIFMKVKGSSSEGISANSMIGHSAIMIFGVVALVVSTYYTIDSIVNPSS